MHCSGAPNPWHRCERTIFLSGPISSQSPSWGVCQCRRSQRKGGRSNISFITKGKTAAVFSKCSEEDDLPLLPYYSSSNRATLVNRDTWKCGDFSIHVVFLIFFLVRGFVPTRKYYKEKVPAGDFAVTDSFQNVASHVQCQVTWSG